MSIHSLFCIGSHHSDEVQILDQLVVSPLDSDSNTPDKKVATKGKAKEKAPATDDGSTGDKSGDSEEEVQILEQVTPVRRTGRPSGKKVEVSLPPRLHSFKAVRAPITSASKVKPSSTTPRAVFHRQDMEQLIGDVDEDQLRAISSSFDQPLVSSVFIYLGDCT